MVGCVSEGKIELNASEKKLPIERRRIDLKMLPISNQEKLGEIFKSSLPVNLTEIDTEIFVRCTKHVFSRSLVLQFDCTNTLQGNISRFGFPVPVSNGRVYFMGISNE